MPSLSLKASNKLFSFEQFERYTIYETTQILLYYTLRIHHCTVHVNNIIFAYCTHMNKWKILPPLYTDIVIIININMKTPKDFL